MNRSLHPTLAAGFLTLLAGAAAASDVTIIVTAPGPFPGNCAVSIGANTVPVNLPPAASEHAKVLAISNALTGAGYAVTNIVPGGNALTITGLTPGTSVGFFPGTGDYEPYITMVTPDAGEGVPPGTPHATITFTGHFPPISQATGQFTVFTAGIVTDLGTAVETITAQELNFQTEGPIICQALFQRLQPRAPQFGAQINYAGDRLEVYFDPAYTAGPSGVRGGSTSGAPGSSVHLVLPIVPPACPADVGVQGGAPGHDNLYDNNDFVAFIQLFFNNDARADLGVQGGLHGHDGNFDNNDFVVFIDDFFHGCPPVCPDCT